MPKGQIKPIQNEELRQICFSKRRQSLFNKASELSILCGAMVGSVTFSNKGRSFSFGHPSVDDVANRFVNNSVTSDCSASGGVSNDNSSAVTNTIHQLNMEYSELQHSLNSEKKKIEMWQGATQKEMSGRMMQLLNTFVSELSLDELQEFQKYLEAIHGVVEEKDTKMLETRQTDHAFVPDPPMEIAPSSSNEFDSIFYIDSPLFNGDFLDVRGLENFPDN